MRCAVSPIIVCCDEHVSRRGVSCRVARDVQAPSRVYVIVQPGSRLASPHMLCSHNGTGSADLEHCLPLALPLHWISTAFLAVPHEQAIGLPCRKRCKRDHALLKRNPCSMLWAALHVRNDVSLLVPPRILAPCELFQRFQNWYAMQPHQVRSLGMVAFGASLYRRALVSCLEENVVRQSHRSNVRDDPGIILTVDYPLSARSNVVHPRAGDRLASPSVAPPSLQRLSCRRVLQI